MPLMLPAMFLGMLQAMFIVNDISFIANIIANDISLMDLQGLTRTKERGVLPYQRTKFYHIKEPNSDVMKKEKHKRS